MTLTDIILQNLIGATVFTATSLMISYFTIKYLIRKAMIEIASDESKKKFGLWLEGVISGSLTLWLKDKKVRSLLLEILELVKERLEATKAK